MRRKRSGLEVMKRAVLALFLREIRTRFGKYQLGYAWAVIEPVGLTAIMILIFSALGHAGYAGIDFTVFLAVGVITYGLFSEISNRSIKAMEANSALFNYRPIRPIDTVLARALLELVLHAGVLFVLLGLYWLFGGTVVVSDMPKLLMAYLLLTAFATGVGILYMLITDVYSDAEKVLPLATRPLFFISGVFFSLESVPRDYWPLLLWNPIFHAIELSREALSDGFRVPGASMGYLASATVAVLAVALFFYRWREAKMRLR
ncbi:MAG: ABC transporter permease [Azovibrio sp.]|nr:ABC transporter permease [Azovibrio sp.]